MNFTFQNHLKYSVGGRPFGFRQSSIEKFKVDVGSVDLKYLKTTSYFEELKRTADLIYKDFGKDLVIFLSGGTDSEIVVRSFVEIGINPKCCVIKFKDNYNYDDVQESISIANDLNCPIQVIEFDVKDFWNSGQSKEFGNNIQCSQITYLIVYYCIKKLSFPSIMGGEVLLRRNVNQDPSHWYYCFRENEDASAMRFSLTYNIPLVNEFFSYTPELLLTYLEDQSIVSLVNTKYNYKMSSASSKNEILKRLVPSIRSKVKTHGFEKLLGLNFSAYRELLGLQTMRLETSLDGIEYNKIIKILRHQNEYL